MLQVNYPKIENPKRSLDGIFIIETTKHYDTILLGDDDKSIELGFISKHPSKGFYFSSVYEVELPFPNRESYAECWQDVLTLIVNEFDLMVELAVLSSRKKAKNV